MNIIIELLRLKFHYLRIFINFSVGVIGDNWGIKEVEEAVCLDLFGDGPYAAFGLVFLLLLDLFHSEIFAFLPVD